jgi:hypothetical protein
MTHLTYTDAILGAYIAHKRQQEVGNRKQEIIDAVFAASNLKPESVLFVGFNPAILSIKVNKISVTGVSDAALKFLTNNQVEFSHVPDLSKSNSKFDSIIALDEYFTYANNDQDQIQAISEICKHCSGVAISTLRDYRNLDFRDREFSQPAMIRDANTTKVYLESHDWDMSDRTRWTSKVYEIEEKSNQMRYFGPFNRRTMFFKQLAKFSIDEGAQEFLVHKNLMYKSLIKRNYEHVISLKLI